MEMMRAVLDSNFWLATHVVTITIGYSGTFLAGGIAIGYTIRKHLVAAPDPDTTKSLESMVYGVVCFALFFSFVGTVLGGIWADQSWGRFWGWDPKENGALLIVLWNAIILHARSGKLVKERGTMAMVIFGNTITSFSWFGVNMLISSHSSLRSQVVPVPVVATSEENDKPSLPLSHYISWSELLKKTFEIDTLCPRCKTPLRLIAMIETEDTIKKILSAMGLPTEAPKLSPARSPPSEFGGESGDWPN